MTRHGLLSPVLPRALPGSCGTSSTGGRVLQLSIPRLLTVLRPRLRELAGRVNGTEDPAAAPAPGQTISGQTTRQPGGCGQAGGA
jgi:hypothetical protein